MGKESFKASEVVNLTGWIFFFPFPVFCRQNANGEADSTLTD